MANRVHYFSFVQHESCSCTLINAAFGAAVSCLPLPTADEQGQILVLRETSNHNKILALGLSYNKSYSPIPFYARVTQVFHQMCWSAGIQEEHLSEKPQSPTVFYHSLNCATLQLFPELHIHHSALTKETFLLAFDRTSPTDTGHIRRSELKISMASTWSVPSHRVCQSHESKETKRKKGAKPCPTLAKPNGTTNVTLVLLFLLHAAPG